MQLSLRLSAVAEMVTEGNRLVDVGCDHGYLPVYLVLTGKIPGAIAADVRSGPLARAREHIARYGLEQYIETRLSDGLLAFRPKEGDTLVIAGMGGPLMERILTEGKTVRDSFSEMVLQPQSELAHFRAFIRSEGFEIVREEMVLEEGKYYPVIKAVPAENEKLSPYTREEEWFGRFLLRERHPVLREYLRRELRIREDVLKRLGAVSSDRAERRMEEIEEEKRLIESALKYYEG